MSKGWIGFDFDGTLVEPKGDLDYPFGKKIPLMIALVKVVLRLGYEARIMTARVSSKESDKIREYQTYWLKKWTLETFNKELEITAEKDYEMVCLFDDRAIRVQGGDLDIPEELIQQFTEEDARLLHQAYEEQQKVEEEKYKEDDT